MRKFVLIICLIQSVFCFSTSFGSVVFNELMIDPEPTVGLPEVEYIELFNRTSKPISLTGWSLYYGDKAYTFPVSVIDSGGYCVLCSKAGSALFPSGTPLVAFSSFPSLANAGKLLYLLSDQGVLVSCVEYSEKWYVDAFKAKGGWSLECIDAANLSGQSLNWAASKDLKGGTPGRLNSVAGINPDTVVPIISGVYVLSPTNIELCFSKSMSLSSTLNYEVSPQTTLIAQVIPGFPTPSSVQLKLSDPLVNGVIYYLKMKDLTDVSGLSLGDTIITFGLPEPPELFDLSLNELLFNPVSGGCDYAEFVNRSAKCIDLSQVWLTNRSENGSFNEGIPLSEKPLPCMPGSYWLLSACADTVFAVNQTRKTSNTLDLGSFISMPDASGNIALLNTSAEMIDEVNYNENWHFSLISQKEGVALEKINPDLASDKADSWCSASSASNYGTPGSQNSQFRAINCVDEAGFSVDSKWITPNNDGQNDRFTINYEVGELSVASLLVYDLNGRIVKTLAKNELLASKGSFFWDGTSDDGGILPFGRYILLTDYFTPNGHRIKERFVLAVLF
jgi:Lamin Tail Domain/CHU_C Type IX secretion signal domain